MRCESAFDFVYAISTKISIVSVNTGRIIFGVDRPQRIFLLGSVTFHELGCKMSWTKAKYPKRISTEKRIHMDSSGSIHIFSCFELPNTENGGSKISRRWRKRTFLHVTCSEGTL